ncbi:MAG: hypothetical protein Q7T33_06485 [Dehalococcoidia bacterium]|nr:hypothetical protein [Dehalococcoidia bacterium]
MRYAALIVPLVALLALACKGGGGPASTPTAAPASPTPTATAPPTAAAEVPAEVQAVIDAALSGDPEAMRALVVYTKIGCITEEFGGPVCQPGEAAGTPVDVLSVGTCEGEYRRADELDEMPLGLLSDLSLYAVYRWPQDSEPAAEYAVLFSKAASAGDEIGVELLVQGERFVHVKFGCGETPAQLVQLQGLEDVVLPPQP